MSLTHLMEEMRDLAGLKPLLTKVWDKHYALESLIDKMLRQRAEFLTEFNLQDQWNIFTNEMRDLVKELHLNQDAKVDDKIKLLALESEVQKRLDTKSSKIDYGSLHYQFIDIRNSLLPLIDKKSTLEKFI